MICLGIESTAHTFGVGIVKDRKLLSDAKDMYKPPEGWGIEPVKAMEHHKKLKDGILEKALKEAGIGLGDVDVIAFSRGPGLPPCLKVGMNAAKELSLKYKKPLVGVNHCVAHIEIGKLMTGSRDPVVIFVSGGNTQILAYGNGYYRCFGETMDVGVGNALDKFGRKAGLGFPAGPKIEHLALKGRYIELPYVVKGMDLSFSGIVTDALRKLEKHRLEDICFSLQETLFSMLAEVTERAVAHTGKKEVLVTGGVAANKRLCGMLDIMCRERGAKFFAVPLEYSGDNGTNIAYTGLLAYKAGLRENPETADINPGWRTDQAEIKWTP